MRLVVLLALLAGVSVAFQTSFNAAAQRDLGPLVLVTISGFTTGAVALVVSLAVARPEFTGQSVGYALASGVLGAVIVGAIAFAAGQGGVARALSIVVGTQLLVSLVLDSLGVFGAGAISLSLLRVLGVVLILVGGILVVRY